jgi:hypothetical protein
MRKAQRFVVLPGGKNHQAGEECSPNQPSGFYLHSNPQPKAGCQLRKQACTASCASETGWRKLTCAAC